MRDEPRSFDPANWFWAIEATGEFWSSAAREFVEATEAVEPTKVRNEAELDEVLRRFGLPSPFVTAADVKAEAQRRIVALVGARDLTDCLVKQLNANMRANELNDIRHSRELTAFEQMEAEALRNVALAVKAIRAASNVLEAFPEIPRDFASDGHWPKLGG